jgi:hypothetical protein
MNIEVGWGSVNAWADEWGAVSTGSTVNEAGAEGMTRLYDFPNSERVGLGSGYMTFDTSCRGEKFDIQRCHLVTKFCRIVTGVRCDPAMIKLVYSVTYYQSSDFYFFFTFL